LAGTVSAQRIYRAGSAELVISSGLAGDLDPAYGSPGAAATVAGYPARVVTGPDGRCVAWGTGVERGRTVCSHAVKPLPAAELLKVARSLR
jgi:hypothetical protein